MSRNADPSRFYGHIREKAKANVTCLKCQHQECKKFGYFGKRRIQRWRCQSCKTTFSEPHEKLTRDTFISRPETAELVIRCLVDGCSIRTTERLTGVNRNTIMRLLVVVGERSARLMDERMRDLRTRYLQVDEIWSFVAKKNMRARRADGPEIGDQWVFVAIDAETKLIPAFRVGKRLRLDTNEFLWDLYHRIQGRTQITTDGLIHYKNAVPQAFGLDADFAQLKKVFGDYGQYDNPEGRYSPSPIKGVISKVRSGDPDPDHISTSFIERSNLTMRMQIRRLTRLTNGFSKKLAHHKAAIALHFAFYNFCRIHSSLRVTPAMEAGLTDHVWTISELLQ